jgi:hypothetical protein
MQVFAPVWVLITLGWLISSIVAGREAGSVVSASMVFIGAAIIFIRSRRPIETWPLWLFTWRR